MESFKKIKIFQLVILFLGFFVLSPLRALEFDPDHPGYLRDTQGERYLRTFEVEFISNPDADGKNVFDLIFDKTLTHEFIERYEQEFGRTPGEQNIRAPLTRFAETEYGDGIWVFETEDQKRKQLFANFMLRRLVEYHADLFLKSSPQTKDIYELKERLSKVNVTVKKGYKLKVNYSLSAYDLSLSLDNPYNIENAIRIKYRSFGLGEVENVFYSIKLPELRHVRAGLDYEEQYHLTRIVFQKPIHKRIMGSLSFIAKDITSPEKDLIRDYSILIGMTWH
ncbi:MAG: hypothetical protein D6797_03590 [Bdellovibrio sp.]|nr:MAG: hypothetical protein D6797_03590 [Bdellovibrio sp.]